MVYFNSSGRLQEEKGEGRQEWEGEGLQKHTLLPSILLRAYPEKKYPKIYIVFPLNLYHWNWRTWLHSNFCLKKKKLKEVFLPRALTQFTKWKTHILGNLKHKVNGLSYFLYKSCHRNLLFCERGGIIRMHLWVGLTFQMLAMLP